MDPIRAIRLNKTVQSNFTGLTSACVDKRRHSTNELLKLIGPGAEDSSRGEVVKYTLQRLTKGLSSNKQESQKGFATALTYILQNSKDVSIDDVSKIAQDTLKPDQKNQTKREVSSVLLGQCFVYMAFIQSGRLEEASEKQLTDILQKLRSISGKKTPLQNMITQMFCQIIAKVSGEMFRDVVLVELQEMLTKGWEGCDANTLSVLIAARTYRKDVIDASFLKKHWGGKKVVSDKTYPQLATIIAGTIKDLPLTHKVCEQLLQYDAKNVHTVWQKVFENSLLVADSRKTFLLISLVPAALKLCTSADQIAVILSPRLVNMMLRQATGKESKLNPAVKKLCGDLVSYCEACKDGDLQVAVVMSLINVKGGLQFDQKVASSTIHRITSTLTDTGAQKLATYCMDVIRGKTNKPLSDDEMYASQRWACQYLPNCIGRLPGKLDAQTDILSFLLLHSYFKQTATKSSLRHCEEKCEMARTASVQKLIGQTYHKALGKVAVSGSAERTRSKKHFIEVLYQLAQYAQKLLSSPKTVTPDSKWDKETKETWEQALQYSDVMRRAKSSKFSDAFQLLLLHITLHMFDEPAECIDVVKDIQLCYINAQQGDKATVVTKEEEKSSSPIKKRKRDSDEETSPKKKKQRVEKEEAGDEEDEEDMEDASWIETLTELLLSLLTQDSALLRTIVNSVFHMLNDVLTPAALTMLMDALTGTDGLEFVESEDKDDDEEMDEDKDDDEDDDDDDEDEDEDEDEEEDESEEEEEEEDNMEVTKSFRKSIAEALGPAAVNSDAESGNEEDEEEFTDEQMFERDALLAKTFRTLRKGNKKDDEGKKKKQLTNFKIRVANVFADLDTSVVPHTLLLPFLIPMVDFIEGAMKGKDQELEKKGILAFNNMCKMKVNPGTPLDVEGAIQLLKDIVEKASKVQSMQSVQRLGAAFVIVVRLLMSTTGSTLAEVLKTPSKAATAIISNIQDILKDVLERFAKRENSKMAMLLSTMVQRQAELLWPLFTEMLSRIEAQSTKVFAKSKLLEIITLMVNKSATKYLGEEDMRKMLPKLASVVKTLLTWQLSQKQQSSKLVSSILGLAYQAAQLADKDTLQANFDFTAELAQVKSKIPAQDVRKKCNRLAALLQNKSSLKVTYEKKEKPAKKQKAKKYEEEEDEDEEDSDFDDSEEEEEQAPPAKKQRKAAKKETEEMEVEESIPEKKRAEKKEGQKLGLASAKRKSLKQKLRKAKQDKKAEEKLEEENDSEEEEMEMEMETNGDGDEDEDDDDNDSADEDATDSDE